MLLGSGGEAPDFLVKSMKIEFHADFCSLGVRCVTATTEGRYRQEDYRGVASFNLSQRLLDYY